MENYSEETYSVNLNEFVGRWESFENYISDQSEEMTEVWKAAEEAVKNKKDPLSKMLFLHGAKAFWQKACDSVTKDNPIRIGYWQVRQVGEDMIIDWYDQSMRQIGSYSYCLRETIEKGLENKENYLLESKESSPFKYVLLMPPMKSKKVISHLHFQYAKSKEVLLNKANKIKQKHWYATMCEAEVTQEDRCKIVKAMHGLI